MSTVCLIFAVVLTASLLECGDAINLALHTTIEFKCTTNGDRSPDWFVNGSVVVTTGDSYGLRTSNGRGITATLTIDGNDTQVTLNIHCEVYEERQFVRVHSTTVLFQGFLPSPENVLTNSSTVEWKPPYFSVNNDTVHVDPHITQYTVYITDNYTGNSIVKENVTETQHIYNFQEDDLCPTYQISAWNAGGEGKLSEPVQESSPRVPLSIAAENISLTLEPSVVHIHIDVDATCVSRMPNFFFITLMTSTGRILSRLNMTHELGQENADYTINLSLVSLPQNVDICTTVARIRAGNSAGMSAPSEGVEVVCSGGSTDQTTAVSTTTSTTASTMGTESDNKQQEGSTTSIAITIGVIVAIGGALIAVVIIGIICCRKYKKRHSKATHVDNDHSESPSLGGPMPMYKLQTESTSVWSQSPDTATTPTSTDSEGSNDHLLQSSPPAPVGSPSLGGPVPLYQPPTPATDLVYVNSEQSTGRQVASDSKSTSVWTQSSDTPPSTDSEGSNGHLLQPSPLSPVGSPHLVYAQLQSVKLTQVQPPANDDPVQYAQIEHQD